MFAPLGVAGAFIPSNPESFGSRATVLAIAREALYIDTPKLGTADQRRIAAILERRGWSKGARGPNGERLFYPPEVAWHG
jgi:hypothetical protein